MLALKSPMEVAFKGREGMRKIVICTGTGCIANGALEVKEAFEKGLSAAGFTTVESFDSLSQVTEPKKSVYLSKSGCQGFCQMGPLVSIMPEDILYTKVKPENVADIIEKTIKNGEVEMALEKKASSKDDLSSAKTSSLKPVDPEDPADVTAAAAEPAAPEERAPLEEAEHILTDYIALINSGVPVAAGAK